MGEEGHSVDQLIEADVQGDAPAPQRVGSLTLPAPPIQITAQMATFFSING